jgi:hypothetical protein
MQVAPVLEFSVIVIVVFNGRRNFAVFISLYKTVALICFVFVLLIIVIYLNFA